MKMHKALRSIAYVSACAGLLTMLRSPAGAWGGVVWLPKLWAASWQPWLGAIGGAAALLSLRHRDRRAAAAGSLGALLGIAYTARLTRKQDHFSKVFGPGWEETIPPGLRTRLPTRRFSWIQPAPPRALWQRDMVIGGLKWSAPPLLCDIWEPPANIPRTGLAVLFLHGGLWQALDKDFLSRPLFRRLAGEGHVVMDLAYSLSPGAGLEQMRGDVKQAILWLKEHSGDYRIDPERIVLMGVSGGAHLALLAAFAPEDGASVRAVVSISGITDLAAFHREYGRTNPKQPEFSSQITDDQRPRLHDRTALDRFLTRTRTFPAYRHANLPGGALLMVYLMGGTLRELPDAYRLNSPITHVSPGCPPTLLVYGGDDFVVDVSHGRNLRRALQQAGAACVYIELPHTVHGFDQYFGVSRRIAPAAQSAAYDIDRFLALIV